MRPDSELVRSGNIEKVSAVHGSLEDYQLLERALNEYEIDTVFHLGAQTIVQTANRCPLSTFESNIKGTWNLLEATRRNPLIERIVIASSDKAYGECTELPYDEQTPLQGRHPYDVSKSCADLITQAYFTTYGLPITISRCGNIFGGGDLNFNRIVPGTIRAVFRGKPPVIRSDGTLIRDYFFVKDAVSAYLRLAESATRDAVKGKAFNFSYEEKLTVLELVEVILHLMGAEGLAPQVLGTAASEIPHQFLSSAHAREGLGWEPEYTLEQGLERTISWYREFFNTSNT